MALQPLQGDLIRRLRSQKAARAIQRGEVNIPHRCLYCKSSALSKARDGDIECVMCGRTCNHVLVSNQRIAEIRTFIRKGVDLTS